jgi:hypothetical protein
MVRRALPLLAWLAAAGVGAGSGCRSSSSGATDGGRDAFAGDVQVAEVAPALALDFAVTGCAHDDVAMAKCTGTPPLTLSFSPVGSAALSRFLWTFGDGTPPSTARAPIHTYVVPGDYDVTLVAEGVVGSLSRARAGFVSVAALGAGAPCDVDAQCGSLRCSCAPGSGCGAAFPRGLCTESCAATACAAGAVCAQLALPALPAVTPVSIDAGPDPVSDAAASPDALDAATSDARDAPAADAPTSDAGDAGTSPRRPPRPLCLAGCENDAACPVGLACRALPGAGAAAAPWTRACLPPSIQEVGGPCRSAAGLLDAALCASADCADLGALGLCSASCVADADCPPGSLCGTFGSGAALCLETCAAPADCTRDPLLRCESAGGSGPLGFQMKAAPAGATFCAPTSCAVDDDCGPAGRCVPTGAGAHCTRR